MACSMPDKNSTKFSDFFEKFCAVHTKEFIPANSNRKVPVLRF
jgi:hypothetical protein